ncbi:Alpha/Beta hydrolase protein [Boletus edulis BED1]|uniref:Carboxylic ester hydrolase n=1 Tax=Boletus edulis BED1 TaxID=1328754 RepID=A0AAD4GLM3_BOLED|nr:Alpha/Beta hydrolase protein [Boletus edulis BED1]
MGLLNVGLLTVFQLSLCLGVFAADPIVDLGYAQYQGVVNTQLNVTNFLGVRYAAAPVGNLRWAAPQAPPTVSGVQQATSEPNECYQAGLGSSSTNPLTAAKKRDVSQSEDCLFLNVHVPGPTVNAVSSGGHPVVVWIHGGGYVGGSASGYDGSSLVFQSQNSAIVVVIQYRLGLFGFLPGAAVKSGGVLNAGLLDQNFALQWVQAHMSKFGGDPTKVTIWGQSAGAGSVLQHVVANGGNTQPALFTTALTSSTYLPPQYNYNDLCFLLDEMLSLMLGQCSCSSSSDTLSCLRSADTGTLSNVNNQIESNGLYGTATFVPVVDGTFIIERPTVTLGKGKHNGEALYSVTNLNEGNQFVQKSLTMSASQYISQMFPNIKASEADSLAALYADFGTNVDQAIAGMSEAIFVCPTYYLMKAFGNNAWKGEFTVSPATHGSDIGYYFTTSTSQFAVAFSNSFLAMVTSGGPDNKYNPADDLPSSWSNWASGDTEMVFNTTSDGSSDLYTLTTDSGLLNRCAYVPVSSLFSRKSSG